MKDFDKRNIYAIYILVTDRVYVSCAQQNMK